MMTKKRWAVLLATATAAPLANAAAQTEGCLHSYSNNQGSGSGLFVGSQYFGNIQQNGLSLCAFSSLHLPFSTSCCRKSLSQSHLAPRLLPSSDKIMSRRSINYSDNLFLSASSSTQNDSSAAAESSKASNENQATPARVARASAPEYPLVLLIGGSGFLGSEIRRQLQERGVRYIATSTPDTAAGNRDDEFVPLDLIASDAGEQFHQLISTSVKSSDNPNKIAVISAMGAIGTDKDEQVNAALAVAIRAAHRANDGDEDVVERFIMIGNTDRVRRLARNVSFLKGYASGKDEAESSLRKCFGSQGCIIKPSFIYGGDAISLQPPRLPTGLGSLASEILGLYPIQSLADALPDALALPLAPPMSVEIVASAAVNIALGIVEGYTEELAGEAIKMAGSVRTWKEKSRYENWLKEELEKDGVVYNGSSKESCSIDAVTEIDEERRWKRINLLKERLLRGDSASVDIDSIGDEVAIMQELECLRPLSMKPANDPKLNGQWNFVLSKDDLGTQLIKELLPPDYYSFGSAEVPDNDSAETSESPPWKLLLGKLYQLKGLYMRIHDEQSQVDIVLSSNICFGKIPIDIVFSTSLLSTNYDYETEGTLFLEKFESIKVGGISLPLPSSWQRFRYLEITYLDEEIVIARGSGGEPHVLVRAND